MTPAILVVGGENLCRSPLGAVLLGQALSDAGINAQVHSAGLWALAGHPVDTFTDMVAREQGIDLRPHRARRLTAAMVQAADLILTFDTALAQDVQTLAPAPVHLFGHPIGAHTIPDPRHRSREFHQAVHLTLTDAARAWSAGWQRSMG